MTSRGLAVFPLLAIVLLACSGGGEVPAEGDGTGALQSAADGPEPIAAEPPALVAEMLEPFHGDFNAMVEEREVRVLVTYSKTNFFLDGATQRGITAELLREFEAALNKELKLGSRPLHVAAIPVPRDRLIPFLEEGRGDIAIASLTTWFRSTAVWGRSLRILVYSWMRLTVLAP